MWKTYFKLKGLKPGKVFVPNFGEVDFSVDNLPVETVQAIYEAGHDLLELTPEGKTKLYPEPKAKEEPTPKEKSTK